MPIEMLSLSALADADSPAAGRAVRRSISTALYHRLLPINFADALRWHTTRDT